MTHQLNLNDSAGNLLLSYDSADREPFYVVNHFHTRKSLVELRYAIDKVLEAVDRNELGQRLAECSSGELVEVTSSDPI